MTKEVQAMSLLPFLSAVDSNFFLQISRKSPFPVNNSSYPFFVLNELDPFSRLLPADIVDKSGDKIKNVFLLLQKDEQISARHNLPLDNSKIKELWQEISRAYSPEEKLLNLLEKNNSNEDQPPLFAPLLFCGQKNIFFHPLCPDCGSRLSQCSDDEILQKAGLEPFSTSLKKYLYCQSCAASVEQNVFFVRDQDKSDPDFVLDCAGLCEKIGQLIADNKAPAELPCGDCFSRQECFGPENLVRERVTPLSFYNFYLLASTELPLQPLDFLAMTANELFPGTHLRDITKNRETIKPLSSPPLEAAEYSAEDKAIFEILTRLRAEWQTGEASPAAQPGPPEITSQLALDDKEPEDDMDKTMIINTSELFPDKNNEPPPANQREEEDMDKTMILDTAELFPDSAPAEESQPQPPVEAGEPEDDMDKTMIINTADIFPDNKPAPATPDPEENSAEKKAAEVEEEVDAEETMILSAEKIAELMNKRRNG